MLCIACLGEMTEDVLEILRDLGVVTVPVEEEENAGEQLLIGF